MIIINIEEKPISVKHICWFTKESTSLEIVFCEVVEEIYRHPQAPEDATISKIATYVRKEGLRTSLPECVLLEAAQRNCSTTERNK